MRIWDVNPGYLNRQSLLGEHANFTRLFPSSNTTKKVTPVIQKRSVGIISVGRWVSATDYWPRR